MALLTVGAVRRARSRRSEGTIIGIDAREPLEAELSARPSSEHNGPEHRVASEVPDYAVVSQRW